MTMAATIISVVAVLVSFLTFLLTYLASQRADRRRRMPVIVVFPEDEGWRLENIGNGPALNIVIAQGRGTEANGSLIELRREAVGANGAAPGETWCNPIHLRPMAAGASQLVPWHFATTGVGVGFTDVLNTPYTLRMSRQGSLLVEKRGIPSWSQEDWRQINTVEAWAEEQRRTGTLPAAAREPWGEWPKSGSADMHISRRI
jgi:hypothetical protein